MAEIKLKPFSVTPALIQAARLVFAAEALIQLVSPQIIAIQTAILAEREFFMLAEFIEDEADKAPIREPGRAWLMGEQEFEIYDARCKEETARAGLFPRKPGNCPMLEAQHAKVKAEQALIDRLCKSMGIEAGLIHGAQVKSRAEFLDLSLRFLSSYL